MDRILAPSIALFVICLMLMALLLPFGAEAIADGEFDLTVEIEDIDSINPQSLLFATVWTTEEADWAVQTGSLGDTSFRVGAVHPNGYTVSVPWSGRYDLYDRELSRHNPEFLVIEYSLTPEGERLRQRFGIPPGRGDRTMRVELRLAQNLENLPSDEASERRP